MQFEKNLFILSRQYSYFVGAEMNKRCRQLREQVLIDAKFNALTVFRLLLNVGQFEFKLKEVCLYLIVLLVFG